MIRGFLLLFALATAYAFDDVDDRLAAVRQSPNDLQVIGGAMQRFTLNPERRVIDTFKEVFAISTDRVVRQALAAFLLTHHQDGEEYFDLLARYAKEAVTTTAPTFVEYDELGDARSKELSSEFKIWCATKHLSISDCFAHVVGYGQDLLRIASVRDKRAIPILREGLGSQSIGIVSIAIKGLGELDDTQSLPLIERALLKLRPHLQSIAASYLVEFDDPRVGTMLDRFVPDKTLRDDLESRRKPRVRVVQ